MHTVFCWKCPAYIYIYVSFTPAFSSDVWLNLWIPNQCGSLLFYHTGIVMVFTKFNYPFKYFMAIALNSSPYGIGRSLIIYDFVNHATMILLYSHISMDPVLFALLETSKYLFVFSVVSVLLQILLCMEILLPRNLKVLSLRKGSYLTGMLYT